jgi:hypothetical protein
MRDIWVQLESQAQQVLSATTLDQLAARHRVPSQESGAMYYI